MKEYRFFLRGNRGCIFGLGIVLLAVCLTVGTVKVQRPSGLFCGGRLSAGYPAAFICDASGESPLSSVGRIDRADIDSIDLPGSILDILFFAVLLWVAGFMVVGIFYLIRRRIPSR